MTAPSGSRTRATAISRASGPRRPCPIASTASPPAGLEVALDGFDKPNGLAFSPDERTLYVTDSGTGEVIALDADSRRRFAVTDLPDGIKTDPAGRVYVSSSTGVQVFDPAGAWFGAIAAPGAVNFAWGETGRLYITTDTAVWAAELGA